MRLAMALAALLAGASGCGADVADEPLATISFPSTTDARIGPDEAPRTAAPEPSYRSHIARVRSDLGNIKVLESPAGVPLQLDTGGTGALTVVRIDNPLPSGTPTSFLVRTLNVERAGSLWHEVYLPVRPNGSTGWIAAADVELNTTDLAATVSLGGHRLELRNEDTVIAGYPIAIGMADTPTPTGRFYVKELVEPVDTEGSYGPIAFGLSAFSPTLVDTEAFADGVIGIHGTNRPELIGTTVSHGCVRMRNEDILDLETHAIPLGMPVTIVE